MFYDVIGWIGMILILLAYGLLSTNKIKNGYTYQILNLLAAIFMGIGVYPKKAWFTFVLEIIWALIAIISMIKMKKRRK